jgi:hypothetical protein
MWSSWSYNAVMVIWTKPLRAWKRIGQLCVVTVQKGCSDVDAMLQMHFLVFDSAMWEKIFLQSNISFRLK